MARANVTFNEVINDSLKRMNMQISSINNYLDNIELDRETFLKLHNECVDMFDCIYNINDILTTLKKDMEVMEN